MKTKYKYIVKYLGVLTFGVLMTTSCTKYLNVAPDVSTTDADVFGSFQKYQGFVEDIYQYVQDLRASDVSSKSETNWNSGLDEGILEGWNMTSFNAEQGDYVSLLTVGHSIYTGLNTTPSNSQLGGKGYWNGGWYSIRKCNIAIRNIGLMVNGTDEQRNTILGQAYFFRAYYHFEILRHWGHIAYIDSVYGPSDVIQPATISYAACAERIDADLHKAALLLPVSWDDPNFATGQATATKNAGRLTKGAAWVYIGLNALYAGSPLMAQDATSPNNPDSTKYDLDWCKRAAEGYGELFKISAPAIAGGDGTGGYDLETWDRYHFNFWSLDGTMQCGKEIVFANVNYTSNHWVAADFMMQVIAGGYEYYGPTQNYIENFGMKNGLPLADPNSGYNPQRPWINRDPRFDYCIQKDSDRVIKSPANNYLQYTYMQFFVGPGKNGSPAYGRGANTVTSYSGFGYKKFLGLECNNNDAKWGSNYIYNIAKERLAGALLEYAEAVNEAYGPTGHSLNCTLTAIDAVNKVRHRVMCPPYATTFYTDPLNRYFWSDWATGGTPLPNVDPKYTADKLTFREIIRKERAVELAFEGFRFDDARRWGVASALHYREKYTLEFDWAHTYFNRVLFKTSIFAPKHWWMPFPTKDVALYPGFKQNPGW